ncbi:MAG: T9SS type A sorting domain-containing protein [Bacteroidetes bacterium]|nr:T9SS type A sorting domain-containing protein [Bacteroidota bacterium]
MKDKCIMTLLLFLSFGMEGIGFAQVLSNNGAVGNITSGTVISNVIDVDNTIGTIGNSGTITMSGNLTNSDIFNGSGLINLTGNLTNNGTFSGNSISFNGATNILGSTYSSLNDATIAASSSLVGFSGNMNIAGNFSNDGTFTHNSGTLTFNGSTAQTIGGTTRTDFNNITLSNSTGVSLLSDERLINTLTINAGTFTTTGFNFTLLSSAAGTASIAPMTNVSADFAGNIIMERFAPESLIPDDWRFLGSAVSGATIADWTDNFATSGFTGATCGPADCALNGCYATCNYPSIYTYDETIGGVFDMGYVAAGNVTDALAAGKGFWVYLGPTPVTFDVPGPPNKFTQPLSVTYTNTGSPADDGWNLVSNPYPSAIDWDDANWTKTNMNDAIYIYNSYTGTYAYHCPLDSSPINGNGGSQYIASQQSFWVIANGVGTPVLKAEELVKASAQNPTFFKIGSSPNVSHYPMTFNDFSVPPNTNNTPYRLKLTATGNGYDDEIFIHFKQGAANNFDSKYDMRKLTHPNSNVQNFSSVMNNTLDLAVNGLPPLTADVNIPLRLTVPVSGIYKISRDSILMFPKSYCLFLEDLATGNMMDLRSTISYSFSIADTTKAPRFILRICDSLTSLGVHENKDLFLVNVFSDHGEVFLVFNLPQVTNVKISIYNMMGQKILSLNEMPLQKEKVLLPLYASSGIYIAVAEMPTGVISRKVMFPER